MSPFAGHASVERAFLSAVHGGRMPHAWLLAGPQGMGKAAFARRAAGHLLTLEGPATAPAPPAIDDLSSHPALRLMESGAHPEYLWLKRLPPKSKRGDDESEKALARNITIEQVRELIGRTHTRPAIGHYRVIVIDAIDDLERGAANALLKTLEEPAAATILMLVSHNPGRLLPTIRSRCRMLRFPPLSDGDMQAFLSQEAPALEARAADAVILAARGVPGRALQLAGMADAETLAILETIAETGDRSGAGRVALARSLASVVARPRFASMLDNARQLAARRALGADADNVVAALAVHERVSALGGPAVAASEDPATVTLAVGAALAHLAKR
jgi:DNA polymerase III subunit delta'